MQSFIKINLRFICILLYLVFISIGVHAQNESKYSLLWKIEGQNLDKPSFLFGTMHIDDSRAFNFSDAVLPAIESCDKFALEIQPDSLMTGMFRKKPLEKAYLTVKNLLTEKEFKRFSKRFFEVNDYPIEESSVMNPNVLLTMLHPEEDKEDDKSSFVDLHLLGHAKTMQKNIVGLEDVNDQLNYFENLSEADQKAYVLDEIDYEISDYNEQFEEMINIYLTGNIYAIDAYLTFNDGYDEEIRKRNEYMCESIISEINGSHSLFSAVGAAHLPGVYGLINLLKKKGYKVTSVEANFTGIAESYTIDDSKMLWYTFTEKDFGYSVETPNQVMADKTATNFDMYNSSDIVSGKNYSFFAIDMRRNYNRNLEVEEFYNQVINRSLENYSAKNVVKNPITFDGVSGFDLTFEFDDDDNFSAIRSLYLMKNGIFYQFFVLGDIEKVNSKSVDRYFKSVKLFEPVPLPEISNEWVNYHNEEGAFSLQLPSNPIDSSREIPSGIEGAEENTMLHLYISQSPNTGENYIVRYNDLPIGYRIDDLSGSFKAVEKSLTSKAELISEPIKIYKDGYEGRQYELMIQGTSHSICKLYFRGNRTYLLLSQRLNEGQKADPDGVFFTSFKFEDFIEEETIEQNIGDFTFKRLKSHKLNDIETEEDYIDSYLVKSIDHYSRNDNNGDMYTFGYSKLKPYFKIDSLQAFYQTNKDNLLNWNEVASDEKTILIDNTEAFEFKTINTIDSLEARHILWLDKDYFILSSAYGSKETLYNDYTNKILKGYKRHNSNQTVDYYSSKTDLILNDLKSKDSLVFKNALGAFDYYEFEESDLKKLYQSVESKYANDKNKTQVIAKVVSECSYNNDENTLSFLESMYNNPLTNVDTKRAILNLIPNLDNDNRLEVYKKLFIKNPPLDDNTYNYSLFRPFKDSIGFAITNYKDVLSLKKHENFKNNIVSISTNILESDHSDKASILPYFDELTEGSTEDLTTYIKMLDEEEYDYSKHYVIYNFLGYLQSLPLGTNKEFIDKFTKPLLKKEVNQWLLSKAAQTRIQNNLPIKKKLKTALLDSSSTRFEIMKAFHKSKRFNEVPSEYKSQNSFSELSLTQYLEDSDEYPERNELLGEVKIKDTLYHIYSIVYEYENTENNKSYLIVVEPYQLTQESNFETYTIHTNWDELEEDWKTQTENLILKESEPE